MALQVSIGQVKRDISELVNRVAYGGERVVLTSRGKPKAVLISIADYEQMTAQRAARFAVIREMQDAAPSVPFKQVEKEVTAAINKINGKNAAGRH
jgi:prevent-host-death family protein